MEYPKINLAIDSCFASKRWTVPKDWIKIISDAGVKCIEISADSEFDPLFNAYDDMQRRIDSVHQECSSGNMRVTSMYSGHGTYSTVGLANDHVLTRHHILDDWLVPFAKAAGAFNAGVGFFMHAFDDTILQDSGKYYNTYNELCGTIKKAREKILENGAAFCAVEQMYSPQQVPWTIAGAKDFIRKTGAYITIDTGHQTGQHFFIYPSEAMIRDVIKENRSLYVGTKHAAEIFYRAKKEYVTYGKAAADKYSVEILEDISKHRYLFADNGDCNLYRWLETLGAYSPIIHLQQTDGTASRHLSFTEEENASGIVKPVKVLSALKRAYEHINSENMPPYCGEITLTLELFYPLTDTTVEIERKLMRSAAYWREYIPCDGLRLNELLPYNLQNKGE